eukprot:scaffold16121_cov68-Cyclotella_meneghiniana.AAC.2
MKVLNTLILSSLVGGTSAWNWPWSGTRAAGTFNDGVFKGGEIAEEFWESYGSDCGFIFSFQDEVDDIDIKYPADTPKWDEASYNRGVQAGADQVIEKYEKQCLEDTPDECEDLGVAAAQEIAFEYCPFNAATSFAPRPDYKEQCRQVATGVCKGSIKEQVNSNGCGISNAKLEDLQAKCRRQVNRMTGAGGNNPIGNRPTPRPTNRPTNRPSRRPRTNRPSNRPTPRPTKRPTRRPRTNRPSNRPTPRPTKRPTRRPTPRPSNRPTGKPTNQSANDSYRAGFNQGKKVAEDIWADYGSDCAFIWSFEDAVDAKLDEECPNNSNFCRGARAGGQRIVNNYEKQCLEDTPDECIDLGNAAAEEIAFGFCPFDASSGFAPMRPDYKESCREVAYGICRGVVGDKVEDNGCLNTPDNKIVQLQNKCVDQVNLMTGGPIFINSPEPTPSPTYSASTDTPTEDQSESAFRAGYKKGQDTAEEIWIENGSDCGFIFSYQDVVDATLEDECPENTNFCRGARAGANKVVFEQEKSCLEDTTDECTELGEAAAQEIAFEFCPFDTSASFAPPSRPDYKEACREVASGICEGAVGNQVNNNGCSLTTSELLMLQDKCEYQVNLMTGGDNGGWIEPLPEPVPFSPPGNW